MRRSRPSPTRVLVDLREMPREVQQVAFDEGMIPFIPADQKKASE